MDFRCVCGKVLSMDVAPGTVVRCPACGQMIQAPGAPPYAPTGIRPVPPPYPITPPGQTSGKAIAALVLGLAALIFGPFTGIAALVLGIVARSQVKKSEGRLAGSGMATAGLVTGAIFSVVSFFSLSIAIMLPALARAHEAARTIQCADNLRNLNLALFQYVMVSNDQMPPADHNVCLALGVHMGDATDDDRGGDHWRCPNDRCMPQAEREYWCSYAPNASVEETDEVIGAFSSNAGLRNSMVSIAPDTISFIEMWTPPNVVDGHPGFLLKLDLRNPQNFDRSMVEPGKELCAIRSYRTRRPVKFDPQGRLVDCGNYLFLRAFIGKKPEEMYHRGRINVAYMDGRVETKPIRDLISFDRPIDNPQWTCKMD